MRDIDLTGFSSELERHEVPFSVEASATSAMTTDFGRLTKGRCSLVVQPRTQKDVQTAVQLANDYACSLTPRGGGNSQSGQSVASGISLDTTRMDGIVIGDDVVRVGVGASFREIVVKLLTENRVPKVVPLNLDLQVGGVMSAGGFGATSHKDGLVVSTAQAFAAVLGCGDAITSHVDANDGHYDALFGTLGTNGVITETELSTRAAGSHVRTFYLSYRDHEAFVADQRLLATELRSDYLEGFCAATLQGMRKTPSGRRAPFAKWSYGLHIGVEFDKTPPLPGDILHGLNFDRHVHTEDDTVLDYLQRYDGRFEAMKATGGWTQAHPWVECFVADGPARRDIPLALERIPLFLGDGHRMSILAEARLPRLLARPTQGPLYAFAVLPMGVHRESLSAALSALRGVHDLLLDGGAKRYLSGWLFEPSQSDWERHYGDVFDEVLATKRRCDPGGVLRSQLARQR